MSAGKVTRYVPLLHVDQVTGCGSVEMGPANPGERSYVLASDYDALSQQRDELREALEEIANLKPRPFEGEPADWQEQIKACEDCQKYTGHPIQQGICDKHRQPIWARDEHERHERRMIGDRAKDIARTALNSRGGQ